MKDFIKNCGSVNWVDYQDKEGKQFRRNNMGNNWYLFFHKTSECFQLLGGVSTDKTDDYQIHQEFIANYCPQKTKDEYYEQL